MRPTIKARLPPIRMPYLRWRPVVRRRRGAEGLRKSRRQSRRALTRSNHIDALAGLETCLPAGPECAW